MTINQDLVHFNQGTYPITTGLLSQFKNWAMVWMYSSTQTMSNQGQIFVEEKSREEIKQSQVTETPILLDKLLLYRTTYQKLRPRNRQNLLPLGGIIQIRKCLDSLEEEIYHDLSQTAHYIPPSKRIPFNPEKITRKRAMRPYKRCSFASSTLVYVYSGSIVRIQPIQTIQDDDDIPLGELLFSNSKTSRSQH